MFVPYYWFLEKINAKSGCLGILHQAPLPGEKAPYCLLKLSKHGGFMYGLTVIAHVLEEQTEAFLRKTMECAHATRNESGNLRKAETESMMAKPPARIRGHRLYFSD